MAKNGSRAEIKVTKKGDKKMINNYGLGWAFFKCEGVCGGSFLPFESDDIVEWMKGFMSAQADYDCQHRSVEAALIDFGVKGDLLVRLLDAATFALETSEWLRLPGVPLRGRAKLSVVSA